MKTYPWQRFWCLREAGFSLGDDGYLYDPTSRYGSAVNPQLATLSAFEEYPCLVMLGEPGMGKSAEFSQEALRVQAAETQGELTLRTDLKEYQTDSRLFAETFASESVRRWVTSDGILNLFFDSLDEGRLEVRNLANILAGQLRSFSAHAHRLRVRIACRTAEWPASLEQAMVEIWGEQAVGVIELAPLRRCDVHAAADMEGINAGTFFAEIRQKEVQPLAINPVTLRFLLGIYAQSKELPATKQSLYEAGCLKLCEESSLSRRDSGHFGHLSPQQRLEIASRIAAQTVFTGRSTIVTGLTPETETEVLTVANLAGGWERLRNDRFNVSESDAREVLGTTAFSGRGSGQLGFAHRTYAEFLAARYVAKRELDDIQIESLIYHSEAGRRIVPQLVETAAWIAVANEDIFKRIMTDDPQVLLRSDVATAENKTKESLIRRLVEGFQNDELDDSDSGLRDHYGKLSHPTLSDQLAPLVLDKSQPPVLRRFVCDVAEECSENGLLQPLVTVALDQTDDASTRAQAAHAIVTIGDIPAIQTLKPLVRGSREEDPNDELLGIALKGLWPRKLITADEVFRVLNRPSGVSFLGEYRAFLIDDLAKHLEPNDLVAGLQWCSRNSIVRDEQDDLYNATVAIVGQSLGHLDDDDVVDGLAEYIVSQLSHYHQPMLATEDYAGLSATSRRGFIAAVVRKIADPQQFSWGLLMDRPQLISDDDLEWVLHQSATASSEEERRRWANVAYWRFVYSDRSQIDLVLSCCESNSVVDEVFGDLFKAIELNSETADQLRASFERQLNLEKRHAVDREPPLLDPPPAERIEACLAGIENGDLKGWPALNRELKLEPRSTEYELDLEDDLTQFPGWIAADDRTQSRIIASAKRFLNEWQPRWESWIATSNIDVQDFSGYRALVLIGKIAPLFLDSLSTERWNNLAPCIVGFPTRTWSGGESESLQRKHAGTAYRHAPNSVIAAVMKRIEYEITLWGGQHLPVLSLLEFCWDDRLAKDLANKTEDTSLSPSSVGCILEELLDRGITGVRDRAAILVQNRSDERSRLLAKYAAVAIWNCCDGRGWDLLSPEFHSDNVFFKEVITEAAQTSRGSRKRPVALSEEQMADLYILLSQAFPQSEDPQHDGAHSVGPRESVQLFRNGILSSLESRATLAACIAIERIRRALPHLGYLSWVLRAAKRLMLQATWTPASIDQLRQLTELPASRLVRSGRELQQVVLESLARLQQRLHGETPAVRDLWDKSTTGVWRPVDENAFSDYVKRHLDSDLKSCGIVSLREVEIRRGYGATGERTDIYVSAIVPGVVPDTFDQVRVIVEVKGCWHDELQTAMETQLRDRYLKDNDCEYGIYVVGWFACASWDTGDSRMKKTPSWTVPSASNWFQSQCEELSSDSCLLKSIVMNTALT